MRSRTWAYAIHVPRIRTAVFSTIPMRSNLPSDQFETADLLVRQDQPFKDKKPCAKQMHLGCDKTRIAVFGPAEGRGLQEPAEAVPPSVGVLWRLPARPSASKNGVARASQPEQPARPLFFTVRIPLSQTNVISEPREGQ